MANIPLNRLLHSGVAGENFERGPKTGENSVRADDSLNPAWVSDQGQLIVEIGIAPVKPAEFVVFKIAQFSGGTSLSE